MKNKWYHKNRWGMPAPFMDKIKERDGDSCVYCGSLLGNHKDGKPKEEWEEIEHLNFKPPFYWCEKENGFEINEIVFCCKSCNCSRGNKKIKRWFEGDYCHGKNRHNKTINKDTVANVVREYLKKYPDEER